MWLYRWFSLAIAGPHFSCFDFSHYFVYISSTLHSIPLVFAFRVHPLFPLSNAVSNSFIGGSVRKIGTAGNVLCSTGVVWRSSLLIRIMFLFLLPLSLSGLGVSLVLLLFSLMRVATSEELSIARKREKTLFLAIL